MTILRAWKHRRTYLNILQRKIISERGIIKFRDIRRTVIIMIVLSKVNNYKAIFRNLIEDVYFKKYIGLNYFIPQQTDLLFSCPTNCFEIDLYQRTFWVLGHLLLVLLLEFNRWRPMYWEYATQVESGLDFWAPSFSLYQSLHLEPFGKWTNGL